MGDLTTKNSDFSKMKIFLNIKKGMLSLKNIKTV